MNSLLEDISKKHQYCVDGALKLLKKAKDFEEIKYKDSTTLYDQFLEALENNLKLNFPDANNVVKYSKRINKKSENPFYNLPEHLVHAYYMLRHLRMRDFKIKIQGALNYFRSIQRRTAFDIHEMKTRDTILGDQEFKPPSDATRISAKNMMDDQSLGAAGNSKKQQLAKARAAIAESEKNDENTSSRIPSSMKDVNSHIKGLSDAFEDEEKKEEPVHSVDRHGFRHKDRLRNKFISTCPIMSRYHTSFGYTMKRVSQAEYEEEEYEYRENMDATAKRFLGRIDSVEFTDSKEIMVKDDFGVYIVYDCVDSDLEMLKNELLLTGSYYIKKQEPLQDSENVENLYPVIDRISCLENLLELEAEYQYKKAQLVRVYMEAYEHIVDPLEQQRFIQMVADVMAERPKLNLDSCSFEDSYKLELEILDKKRELVESVMRFQIRKERRENEKIYEYLEKAHKIVNDNIKGKWKYFRPEDISKEFEKRGLENEEEKFADHNVSSKNVGNLDGEEEGKDNSNIDMKNVSDSPGRGDRSPSKKELQDLYKQK